VNRDQAQEALLLYRPGSADAHDSDFAEALELAQHDAPLGRWFVDHCATYGTIQDRLKQIAIPAGLKEQILAEQTAQLKVVTIPRSSWLKPVLAIAAVIILLLSIASRWLPLGTDNESTYRNRMVSTALRNYGMDIETNDMGQIRAFLAQKNAPSDYALPAELQKLECVGAVVLRWQDRPVSMICFRTGRPLAAGETSDFFFFVTDLGSLAESSPTLKQVNKLMTASWTAGDKFYLLATYGDEEFLRRFL